MSENGQTQTIHTEDHEHAVRLAEMLAAADSGSLSIDLLSAYREIIRLAVESLRGFIDDSV